MEEGRGIGAKRFHRQIHFLIRPVTRSRIRSRQRFMLKSGQDLLRRCSATKRSEARRRLVDKEIELHKNRRECSDNRMGMESMVGGGEGTEASWSCIDALLKTSHLASWSRNVIELF